MSKRRRITVLAVAVVVAAGFAGQRHLARDRADTLKLCAQLPEHS